MPIGGGPATQITSGSGDERYPVLSVEGDRIAFSRLPNGTAGFIYIVHLATLFEHQVTFSFDPADADLYPAWSGDGQKIYFVRRNGFGVGKLMQAPVQGGIASSLLTLGGSQSGPHMGHDGARFVFGSTHVGGVWNVFECRTRTLAVTQLTFDTAPPFQITPFDYSPDDSRILCRRLVNDRSELYELNRATLVLSRLTFDVCGNNDDPETTAASWSPDGMDIFFSSRRLHGDSNIWRMPAQGAPPSISLVCPNPMLPRLVRGEAYSFSFRLCGFVQTTSVPWCYSDALGWTTPTCGSVVVSASGAASTVTVSGTVPLNASLCDTNVVTFTAMTPETLRCEVAIPLKSTVPPPTPTGTIELFSLPLNEYHIEPCWTPDGHYIVYGSSRNGDTRLFRQPVAGGPEEILTRPDPWIYPIRDYNTRVSRDGTMLVMARRTGMAPNPEAQEIFTMPISGGNGTQITYATPSRPHSTPEFSLDRSTIYFVVFDGATGLSEIMKVSSTGSVSPSVYVALPGNQAQPRLSRDGTRLAFASNHLGGAMNVFECPVGDPNNLIQLSFEDSNTVPEDYSPDDTRILCRTFKYGGEDLIEIHRTDLSQRRMTFEGNATRPTSMRGVYSPDGSRIAFSALREGMFTMQVYILNLGASGLPVCIECPPDEEDPVERGTRVSLPFTFCNSGVAPATYVWRVADDLGWASPRQDSVPLQPGESHRVTIDLQSRMMTRVLDSDTNYVRFSVGAVDSLPLIEQCVVAIAVAPVPTAVTLSRFDAISEAGGVRVLFEYADGGRHLTTITRLQTGLESWEDLTSVPLGPESHGEYLDTIVARNASYTYRLYEILPSGHRDLAGEVTVRHTGSPGRFAISAVGPNPFRSTLELELSMPEAIRASVDVYDVGGRRVRRLLANTALNSGSHRLQWDGRNDQGSPVRDGIFFVRAVALATGKGGARQATLRVLRIK
jgi:Tol biopolymer transport system component